MNIKSIITISGRISSGKSYAAKLIQKELGFPIASFGGYLKDYCEKNGLLVDRKTLQDTGEAFVKENPKQFLIDTGANQIVAYAAFLYPILALIIPFNFSFFPLLKTARTLSTAITFFVHLCPTNLHLC